MAQPSEHEAGGIQSHQLSDLQDSLTPERSPRVSVDEPKSSFKSADPADVPLTSSKKALPTESETSTATTTDAASGTQNTGGGGVTGFIRSLIGGGGSKEVPAETTSSPEAISGEQQVTHQGELADGQSATVTTAGKDHSAVPTSLKESDHAVGVARTDISEPVSQYAPALEAIAGEPVKPDSSAKYGHALDSITGDAPAPSSPGVLASVTGAAGAAVGSAVETVKHAVGYDTADTQTHSEGVVTPAELPKSGVVNTSKEGEVKIDPAKPTTDSTGKASTAATTGVTTVDDLPQSGAVKPHDGSATIAKTEGEQNPGILAAAAGTVTSGAQYVKDSVAGLVGTGQAGDTSEQVKEAPATTKTPIEYEEAEPATGSTLGKESTLSKAAENPLASKTAPSQATAEPAATAAPATTAAPTARDLVQEKSSDTTGTGTKGAATGTTAAAGTGAGIAAGKATDPEKKAEISSESSKPVVSAFASPSSTAKESEIKEDLPTSGATAQKADAAKDVKAAGDAKSAAPTGAAAAATKPASGSEAATKGAATGTAGKATDAKPAAKTEKESSACCGCCVIS